MNKLAGKVMMLLICSLIIFPLQSYSSSERISGDSRFNTAAEIAANGWKVGAETVVLARGDSFPDALAGAPLAYYLDAPILLTSRHSIPDVTLQTISKLKPKTIVILGGDQAIDSSIGEKLKNNGYSIDRIAGDNRYETAVNIAKRLPLSEQVVVTTGENFPDALAIASIAARKGMPILLSNSHSLSKNAIKITDHAQKVYAIGGSQVLPDKALSSINSVNRIDGKDRYETARNVLSTFDISYNQLFLSTGEQFADALTGSVLAAKNGNGVLLVHPSKSDSKVKSFIKDQQVKHLVTLGGASAIPERVVRSLVDVISMSTTEMEKNVNVTENTPSNGTLIGTVISTDSTTNIKAFDQDGVLVDELNTKSAGKYSLVLPAGTYHLVFSNAKKEVGTYSSINVTNGENQILQDIKLFPEVVLNASVLNGTIIHSNDGTPIEFANISIRKSFGNISGDPLHETITTESGAYSFTQMNEGIYTVSIAKEGYMDNYINVIVDRGKVNNFVGILSPIMEENEDYRIVLSWDKNIDLDAHLTGPAITTSNDRFHLYWHAPEIIGKAKFLSLDQKEGNNPETISIYSTSTEPYYYYVFNYSYRLQENSLALSMSNAKVEVYKENELVDVNFVPFNEKGRLWKAFTIKNNEVLASTSLTDGYTFLNTTTFDIPFSKLLDEKE